MNAHTMSSVKRWSLAGFFAVILLGFVWHGLYAWSGASGIVALLAPVNESVWEHLKLGYWSVILFSPVEFASLKGRVNNYVVSKAVGVMALETTVIAIYYGYTTLLGKGVFWVDILSYVAGAALCQYISYRMLLARPLSNMLNRVGLAALLLMGFLWALTTHYPMHTGLFRDQHSGAYGLEQTE